jgi:putative Mn2+ efflux pump MntP
VEKVVEKPITEPKKFEGAEKKAHKTKWLYIILAIMCAIAAVVVGVTTHNMPLTIVLGVATALLGGVAYFDNKH